MSMNRFWAGYRSLALLVAIATLIATAWASSEESVLYSLDPNTAGMQPATGVISELRTGGADGVIIVSQYPYKQRATGSNAGPFRPGRGEDGCLGRCRRTPAFLRDSAVGRIVARDLLSFLNGGRSWATAYRDTVFAGDDLDHATSTRDIEFRPSARNRTDLEVAGKNAQALSGGNGHASSVERESAALESQDRIRLNYYARASCVEIRSSSFLGLDDVSGGYGRGV